MSSTIKRRIGLALGLSLVSSALALTATPAGAAEVDTAASCTTVLSTTPAVEVDLNNDGNPEYRAPRIHDVYVCSDAAAGYRLYPPTIDNCSSVKLPHCVAVMATILPAYAGASASLDVCYTVEGSWPTCVPFDSPGVDWSAPRTICVGVDTQGGSPCGGGIVTLE